MYSGIQLTDVITNTFQQKCHDQRNVGSANRQVHSLRHITLCIVKDFEDNTTIEDIHVFDIIHRLIV